MDLFLILKLHFQKARRVRLAVLIDLQATGSNREQRVDWESL